MSLDQKNLEINTGIEQMAALKNQIALLKEKSTASERKMLELNGELSRQVETRKLTNLIDINFSRKYEMRWR